MFSQKEKYVYRYRVGKVWEYTACGRRKLHCPGVPGSSSQRQNPSRSATGKAQKADLPVSRFSCSAPIFPAQEMHTGLQGCSRVWYSGLYRGTGGRYSKFQGNVTCSPKKVIAHLPHCSQERRRRQHAGKNRHRQTEGMVRQDRYSDT
jgi:hypothetical protein